MSAGKGRQFKRREGEGEIIAAPRAAALACLGPVRNWQPKRLCAPISSWELPISQVNRHFGKAKVN